MKLSDVAQQESASLVQPSEDGVKLRLVALPSVETLTTDKGSFDKVTFNFKSFEGNDEFNPGMLSPYNFDEVRFTKGLKENAGKKRADTEDGKYASAIKGGFGRLLHIFGCFMTAENYEILKEVDVDNLHDFVEAAQQLYAEDLFEIEFDSVIGYQKQYIVWPKYGDCLSSKYKPKSLMFKPASDFTLKPTAVTPDAEGGRPSSGSTKNYNTNDV